MGGGAGWILMIFSALPHETEEMVKISPMARLHAHACNFCITMLAKTCMFRFFGGFVFHLGASTSHFLGSTSNARGKFEPKKTWLPQITPKFGQKRALGGPKIGQFFCDSFVKNPIKHVGKI